MPYKLHFVQNPGAPPFQSYVVAGSAPNISVGDFVQLPVKGGKGRFRISSILHSFPPNEDPETFYDCDLN